MITQGQADTFVSRVRGLANKVKEVKDETTSLTDIYTSQNIAVDLTDAHLQPQNAGINLAEFNAAVAVLVDINTALKAGNPSQLTKLIKIL